MDRLLGIIFGTMFRNSPSIETAGFTALLDLLRGRRVVVLSGAGCSTESGIPDYRGPEGRRRRRPPLRYGEFMKRPEARVRYWARSTVGWPRFSRAAPNAAHDALAAMEASGVVRGIITQNVDGLHHGAGSRNVVELHGSLAQVRCLGCDDLHRRQTLQKRLVAENASWVRQIEQWRASEEVRAAPDGDADLPPGTIEGFHVPDCRACGGILKPDVVLFGESVPGERVDSAWRLFEEADVLLVIGSSLSVYSGRRFMYRAEKEGLPIGVVNLGPTRADELAAVKVEARLGELLPHVAAALDGSRAS